MSTKHSSTSQALTLERNGYKRETQLAYRRKGGVLLGIRWTGTCVPVTAAARKCCLTLCPAAAAMKFAVLYLFFAYVVSQTFAFAPAPPSSWRAASRLRSRTSVLTMPGEPQPDPQPDPSQPGQPPRTPVPMPTVGEGREQMDVMSRLLKDRILLLGQDVNDEVGNVLVAQLLYLANDDPEKDITLYINSPGGSVSAGLAIYDTMQVTQQFSFSKFPHGCRC